MTETVKSEGVAMYFKSSINYKERHDLQQNDPETITV